METTYFQNRGVTLHALAAGPRNGPLVVLLHGFPEFWYSWHKQIQPLAAAGFRVIVPDQRGYNESSKPRGVKSYALTELTSDVVAIADQLGRQRILLAGHDWGGAVAWSTALLYPARVARLAILNVPHPSVLHKFLLTDRRQLRRSWYMFFFQIPFLPEMVFSANNFRWGIGPLVGSSRPGTFTQEDLARYRAAWSQRGAVSAMINWYRAAFRYRPSFPDRTVRLPTRILWGQGDAFLRFEMAEASLCYCTDGELIPFPNATHWLQHEEPGRVSQLLVDFFQGS